MAITVLKGTLVEAVAPDELRITEGGYLVAEEGTVVGTFATLPDAYAQADVTDYGDALLLQSFSDMHLHAPQYPMMGVGAGEELLDWLEGYTFPTEEAFDDADYARTVSRALAGELIAVGTTRVCMFASIHKEAALVLMEELERVGITGYVGKVNMDRNAPAYLCESTEASVADTVAFLDACEGRFAHIRPILTPRFSPACTEALMDALGQLSAARDLPVQSHLSENRREIAWVKSLYPDSERYGDTYAKFGLWHDRTLMAHAVWSDEVEMDALRAAGVYVVHCPSSNTNLRSGIAPVCTMRDRGIKVVLGSDMAAGSTLSGLDIVREAVQLSGLREVTNSTSQRHLTLTEAWYMATSAAGEFFGERPGFAPGNHLGVMVVEDKDLPVPHALTVTERFARMFYRRQKGAIRAVYSGEHVHVLTV